MAPEGRCSRPACTLGPQHSGGRRSRCRHEGRAPPSSHPKKAAGWRKGRQQRSPADLEVSYLEAVISAQSRGRKAEWARMRARSTVRHWATARLMLRQAGQPKEDTKRSPFPPVIFEPRRGSAPGSANRKGIRSSPSCSVAVADAPLGIQFGSDGRQRRQSIGTYAFLASFGRALKMPTAVREIR